MGLKSEGSAILDSCEEMAGDEGHKITHKRKLNGVLVTLIDKDKKKHLYEIPDLGVFADEHQKALDDNSRLNGYTAALHVLNKKYKIASIA